MTLHGLVLEPTVEVATFGTILDTKIRPSIPLRQKIGMKGACGEELVGCTPVKRDKEKCVSWHSRGLVGIRSKKPWLHQGATCVGERAPKGVCLLSVGLWFLVGRFHVCIIHHLRRCVYLCLRYCLHGPTHEFNMQACTEGTASDISKYHDAFIFEECIEFFLCIVKEHCTTTT